MPDPKYKWTDYLSLHGKQVERCSDGVFFRPRREFVDWLTRYSAGSLIVDCGAGRARLGYELRKRGADVLCLDQMLLSSRMTDVHQKNCVAFDFPVGCVAAIARPSRGPWIHQTIIKALSKGQAAIYVGLGIHVQTDIETLPSGLKAVKIMANAGECGEEVYEITVRSEPEAIFI